MNHQSIVQYNIQEISTLPWNKT